MRPVRTENICYSKRFLRRDGKLCAKKVQFKFYENWKLNFPIFDCENEILLIVSAKFCEKKGFEVCVSFCIASNICYTMISRITRCWPPLWPLYEWDEFPSLSSTNVSPLSAFSIAKLLSPCWWCWCRMLPLPPLPPPPPISAERLSKNFAYRFSPFAHAGESPGELFYQEWFVTKCGKVKKDLGSRRTSQLNT